LTLVSLTQILPLSLHDALPIFDLGLVAEVLSPDKLLARAWELAEDLAKRPTLLLRYTRLLLTEKLRREMHDLLGYGLGMEMLARSEEHTSELQSLRHLVCRLLL